MENGEKQLRVLTFEDRAQILGELATELGRRPLEPTKSTEFEDIMHKTGSDWGFSTRNLAGGPKILAERTLPVSADVPDEVVGNQSQPPVRYFIKQGHRVLMLAQTPLSNEDTASILRTELALMSTDTSKKNEIDERLPKRELIIKPSHTDVLRLILLPEAEIAQQLGLEVKIVNSRVRSFRSFNRLSTQSMIERGIKEGKVDTSILPDRSLDVLTSRQYELVINHSFRPPLKAAQLMGCNQSTLQQDWIKIYEALGVQTRYAAYAIAIRDELVHVP